MPELRGNKVRRFFQFLWLFISNPYPFFLVGRTLYQGKAKLCLNPALNCHSCPMAIFSCPIGALQSGVGTAKLNLSLGKPPKVFYVLGFLGAIGTIFGRAVCGWICPFGFFQDILKKLSKKRIKLPRALGRIKYAVLFLLVLSAPLFLSSKTRPGELWFCRLICPVGTLEAGIPQVLVDSALRSLVGWLFAWKILILLGFLTLSVFYSRPFCRLLCPLGAIYGFFNKVSIVKIKVNTEKCNGCERCKKACPMDLVPYLETNSPECIRCFSCVFSCERDALEVVKK